MQRILLLLCILFSMSAEAQGKKSGPIFPGCEQSKSLEQSTLCFSQELNRALAHELQYFAIVADYLEIAKAKAKTNFILNKDGLFTDVRIDGDNEVFNGFIFSTFYLLNSRLDRAKLSIIPAKNEKGKAINTPFSIPVKFDLDAARDEFPNFNRRNRVLFTFYNARDKEDIEIRIDTTYTISTYAIGNQHEFFLGNYKSLVDLAMSAPYSESIQQSFHTGTTLVTKGILNQKEYTIRLKNFFNNDPASDVYIEVYREENNEWKEYYRFNSKEEFNESEFVKLTYR